MGKVIFNWIIRQLRIAKPLHPDHLGVCLTIVFFGWILVFISDKTGMFNPIKDAFDDFQITDIYYEVLHTDQPDIDNNIVIVDMTHLRTRDEIAQAITDIKSCAPKLLCIDLIFERPSFDTIDDAALVTAIESPGCQQILSCKLRNYDKDKDVFADCLYSFFKSFDKEDNIKWGYSNYRQIRMGGCTRETSLYQHLNDSTVFSLSYTAANLFLGKELKTEQTNERLIRYDDIDFQVIKSDSVLQFASKLKDKLVILGTINEEADTHFTPLGKMAGVKVLAYSIQTYILGGEIKASHTASRQFIALVAWWLAACIGYWLEKRHPIIFSIIAKICNFAIGAFLIWFSFEAYIKWNYSLNLLYPLLGLALAEDVRELYSAIIPWLQIKTHWKVFEKSLYKRKE